MNCNELTVCMIILIILFVAFVAATSIIIIKLREKLNNLQKSYESLSGHNESHIGQQISGETGILDNGVLTDSNSQTTEANTASDDVETIEKPNIMENDWPQNATNCMIETEDEDDDSHHNPEYNEDIEREIDLIIQRMQECPGVSERLMSSPVYGKLKKRIDAKSIITYNDDLWKEIDNLVEDVFSGFRKRLMLLFDRKFREAEIRVIMLLKFGFKESQTAMMVNMPRSNMNYYKEKFYKNPYLSNILEDYDVRQIIYHM